MKCKVQNNSNLDMSDAMPLLKSLYSFAESNLNFTSAPNISFQSDIDNAAKTLGKTAHYHPDSYTITVYTDSRHLKDILRSIAHELIHHDQNCNGAFKGPLETGRGYAQRNASMRELERDAYERGNMIFRDWEDMLKLCLTESDAKKNGLPKVDNKQQKEIIKGNQDTKEQKPKSNDEWYQNNLYKSLVNRWVKK